MKNPHIEDEYRARLAAAFPITLRLAEERDMGFIVSHWLTSLRADQRHRLNAERRRRKKKTGGDEKAKILGLISSSTTIVACDPDSDGAIVYGFACGDSGHLHYVFARETRRRGGLATAMLRELMDRGVRPAIHSYATRDGSRWWARGSHVQAA